VAEMDKPEQLADISYHDMLEAPVEAVLKPKLRLRRTGVQMPRIDTTGTGP
jgi:hypothetical protein